MIKHLQISAVFLLLFNLTLLAQPSASFNFTTAIPMGDFKNYANNVGFGGNIEFFFFSPSERTPYGLGINLSYISYGVHLLTGPESDELSLSFNKANNFASVYVLFQIAPHTGTVRPYFETLFGGSYIFSLTEVGYDYYSPVTLWIDVVKLKEAEGRASNIRLKSRRNTAKNCKCLIILV